MMRGLKDKRVLVTGGASGIGQATAARFLEEGSHVAVLDRDAAAAGRLKKELPGLAATLLADVSDRAQVERAFAELDALWGGLDVLINNAGISIRHSFLDITPEDWQRVLATNLNGVFHVAWQAATRMANAKRGVIINMGSTNALRGHAHYADYNASKAGVLALTRTMAVELAPAVRVLAVCPGYVLTPMQRAEYTDAMLEEVNRRIPLGRHARPGEVAALFAFLASDDANYLTGCEYLIDGGETAC